MPFIKDHEMRVIGLIDELFAAKLALIKVRNTLQTARASGVVSEELMATPALTLIDYINQHIKTS